MLSKFRPKLTKEQVEKIPELLKRLNIDEVAVEYGVSWQAIWYWIRELRRRGVECHVGPKGRPPLLGEKLLF